MKTYKLTLTTLLLTFFLTINAQSQIPAIDSLRIIPANPTAADNVKIISNTTFPSGGCPLTSSYVNIMGTTITVSVSHTLGFLQYICISKDTLTIGILNAGTYELTYNLYLTDTTGPPILYDIDTIIFIVKQPSGFQPTDYSEQKINVYPNPTKDKMFIEFSSQRFSAVMIELVNKFGTKVYQQTKPGNTNTIEINVNVYPNGFYFIKVYSNETVLTKKIIIQH